MHILIEMPSFLGDAVNATPALEMLHQRFPEAQFCLLLKPHIKPLFDRDPRYQFVLDKRKQGGLSNAIEFFKWCRKHKPDVALSLTSKFGSALAMRLAGIPKVYGYSTEGRGFLLSNKKCKLERTIHYANRYAVAANLLCDPLCEALPKTHLVYEESQVLGEIKSSLPKVALYTGGTNKTHRHYPVEKMAEVVNQLARRYQLCFVLIGDPGEVETNQALSQLFDSHVVFENTVGKTSLHEYIDVVAGVDALISIDSSPVHIAGVAEVPMTVLLAHGKNVFSTVKPRVRQLWIADSEGGWIYDYDQMRDLPAEHVIEVCGLMLDQVLPDSKQ